MDNILTRFLSKRPLSLIAIVLILTGIFSYVSSEDNTVDEVSFDTGGKVFDLSEKVNRNFQSPVHFTSVIVESKNNDLLVPDTFKEILENQENLIKSDNSGQLAFKGGLDQKRLLFKYFDLSSGEEILGLSSVVDLLIPSE